MFPFLSFRAGRPKTRKETQRKMEVFFLKYHVLHYLGIYIGDWTSDKSYEVEPRLTSSVSAPPPLKTVAPSGRTPATNFCSHGHIRKLAGGTRKLGVLLGNWKVVVGN